MPNAMASAVFAVIAKDAASKVLGTIGKSMGRLKGAAGAAFRAITIGAAAAASAIAAFSIAAIKSAAEDEKATIRLNAALKARGFEMDKLTPKIDEQIKAMARLGFTDDDVRNGLEVGSRFFTNQNKLLKANALAANISAATGKPLATVMMAIGKGAQGSMKGLAGLGIELEKGATLTDILRAGNEKYKGVAEEIANSTAGKFEAAQIRVNEAFESFGATFLPKVSDALDFLSENVLPKVEEGLGFLGGKINETIDGLTAPGGMVESVGKVVGEVVENFRPEMEEAGKSLGGLIGSVGNLIAALWGDGDGALAFAFKALGGAIELAFAIAKPFFDALKWLVDNITAVINALTSTGTAAAQAETKAAQAAAANSSVFGLGNNAGDSQYTAGSSGYGYLMQPQVTQPIDLTNKTTLTLDGRVVAESVAHHLGITASTTNPTRNTGRNR